jgi:cytochrome c biogenesis factor
MIVVAEMSLWIAVLMAAWAAIVSIIGGTRGRADLVASGERAVHAVLVLLAVGAGGLWTALFARDFSIAYVASHTTANLPAIYTISAFWAGRGGSLLLWSLLLAGCAVLVLYANRNGDRTLMPFVTAALAAVMLPMIASVLLAENPFARLSWLPPEGRGMSPQLQSVEMVFYLPVLYLGYAATAVPFALAAGALVVRRITPELLAQTRRWTVVAWVFVTVGILIGMHWAYLDPAWRGRWVWQPVESAALLPWLVITAFLVSSTAHEKSGVVRKWNVILLMSAFVLAIFATLSPGSGVITDVRSLAQSPGGPWMAGAFAAAIVISGVLVIDRFGDLDASPASGPDGSKRRRYGVGLAGFGAVVLLVGLAAQLFRTDRDFSLQTGETAELADPYGGEWQVVSEGVSRYLILNRRVTAATIAVYHDQSYAGLLTTERRQHVDSRGAPTYEPSTEAGLVRTVLQDMQAVLAGVTGEDTIVLRVTFNPLVWLVWAGGVVAVLGGLLAMWPRRQARPSEAQSEGNGQ